MNVNTAAKPLIKTRTELGDVSPLTNLSTFPKSRLCARHVHQYIITAANAALCVPQLRVQRRIHPITRTPSTTHTECSIGVRDLPSPSR